MGERERESSREEIVKVLRLFLSRLPGRVAC